jgi:hypothetical protein
LVVSELLTEQDPVDLTCEELRQRVVGLMDVGWKLPLNDDAIEWAERALAEVLQRVKMCRDYWKPDR